MFYNTDALVFIKGLKDKTVDLVLTDPPYNISKENNFKTMGRSGIDFGEWDKGFDINKWIELIVPKIKKGGSLIFFNDWKNVSEMSETANEHGLETKDLIRWIKNSPMPRNRDRRYVTDFEVGVWLVKKGDKWTFNRLNDTYDRPEYLYSAPNGKKRIHPTQKPVELLEEILKRHTNEGDLVVDPFAGSCSTAVACVNTKRNFIVNDIDSDMLTKGKFWVEESQKKNGGTGAC